VQPPKPKAQIEQQTPRKRKFEEEHESTLKRQIVQTPSRGTILPWAVDPYDSPSVIRNLFTPVKKTALGPTPQKDGQVLGIFDLLQKDDDASPLKLTKRKSIERQVTTQETTRKPNEENSGRHSRTPASAGKRYMLDSFATPLKNRSINGQGFKTPSSVSKLQFSTPSFLRRDSQRMVLPPVDENEDGILLSPQMVRIPRKPMMRGLSSMLAGLRKLESDAADEDLAVLDELENEAAGISIKPPTKPKPQLPQLEDNILAIDSQPGLPLGGFDDEAQFDSDPEEVTNPNLGRDGQPLKVYKKKGQKRTTRRVKLKPTRTKPEAPTKVPAEIDSEDELNTPVQEANNGEEAVEGEEGVAEFADSARNFDSDSQSEYTASEGGTRYRRPDQNKKRKVMGKDGKIRSVARKVTAAAHQNFKRLKLRNSGAKGPVAHNSRFRRKR
jgi:DNA replication regulator SLD2